MYELNFTTALTYAEVETDAGKGQSKRRRQVPWRCLWKQWKQRQNGQKPLESRWEAIGKPLDILVSCMMSRVLNVAMFVHYCSLTYEFHGTSNCRGISLSLWKRFFWWGIWRTSRQGGHGTGMPATNHDESWRIAGSDHGTRHPRLQHGGKAKGSTGSTLHKCSNDHWLRWLHYTFIILIVHYTCRSFLLVSFQSWVFNQLSLPVNICQPSFWFPLRFAMFYLLQMQRGWLFGWRFWVGTWRDRECFFDGTWWDIPDIPFHLCACVPGWKWKLAALLTISSMCQQQVIDRRERSVAYQKEIIKQCLGLSWIVLIRSEST